MTTIMFTVVVIFDHHDFEVIQDARVAPQMGINGVCFFDQAGNIALALSF
jgi:hypothetical protein